MICHRCQGLMVEEELRDWGGGRGHDCSESWRCIVCGEIVDAVIRTNRNEVKKVSFGRRKKQTRHRARAIQV